MIDVLAAAWKRNISCREFRADSWISCVIHYGQIVFLLFSDECWQDHYAAAIELQLPGTRNEHAGAQAATGR